jgi:hypothetical protein
MWKKPFHQLKKQKYDYFIFSILWGGGGLSITFATDNLTKPFAYF